MKQYEEVFFRVLRTALWQQPLEIPQGFSEWGEVMRLAKAQTLTGLVGEVLLKTPEARSALSEQFVLKIQKLIRSNMLMHTLLNNTLLLVVSRLRENGVESVLLKGQGIARNYPVPELRQCGDIDIYVGMENYEKAYDVLAPLATEIEDKSILEVGKHFHFQIGAVTIEVHRYASTDAYEKQNQILQKYSSEGLNHNLRTFDFAGTAVNTPSDDFNAFFVFYHMWHHFMGGGVGLRQLCDWMMFLHARHATLSQEKLRSMLTDMDMVKPWQVFGCILVDYMGMPSSEMPLYDPGMKAKAKRVLRRIMWEGNFGFESVAGRKRTKFYIYEKAVSLMNYLVRYSSILFIFPSHTLRELWHVLDNGFRQVFHDLFHRNR